MVALLYRPNHPRANANGMVPADIAPPRVVRHGNAPYVIGDHMESTRHMANGKFYDSKSKFRQATRDAGCVEVGNDTSILKPRAPVQLSREKRREDIRQAVQRVRDSAGRKRRRRQNG